MIYSYIILLVHLLADSFCQIVVSTFSAFPLLGIKPTLKMSLWHSSFFLSYPLAFSFSLCPPCFLHLELCLYLLLSIFTFCQSLFNSLCQFVLTFNHPLLWPSFTLMDYHAFRKFGLPLLIFSRSASSESLLSPFCYYKLFVLSFPTSPSIFFLLYILSPTFTPSPLVLHHCSWTVKAALAPDPLCYKSCDIEPSGTILSFTFYFLELNEIIEHQQPKPLPPAKTMLYI